MDGGKMSKGVYILLVLAIIASCSLPLLLMHICHYGHREFLPSVGTPVEFMLWLLHELAS